MKRPRPIENAGEEGIEGGKVITKFDLGSGNSDPGRPPSQSGRRACRRAGPGVSGISAPENRETNIWLKMRLGWHLCRVTGVGMF